MGNELMGVRCARTQDNCLSLQNIDGCKTIAYLDNIVGGSSGMVYLKDNAGCVSVRYLTAETTV